MSNYYKVHKSEASSKSYNCPISRKFAQELAREVRGKPVNKVIVYLNDVIAKRKHVPLRHFNRDVGHRKGDSVSGVKSGRYPVKVAKYVLKTLEGAISNATYKGLDKDNLFLRGCVISMGFSRASIQPQGKKRVRAYKGHSANIEIVVSQIKKSRNDKAPSKKSSETKPKADDNSSSPKKTVEVKEKKAKVEPKKATKAKKE